MYDYFRGVIIEKNLTDVVIEVNQVGYRLLVSTATLAELSVDETATVYVKLMIKEDEHSLCGFAHKAEREFFGHLISVSGIGQRVAMNMLSRADYSDILGWIISGADKQLVKLPGLGKKTAQRLIVELKDKLIKLYGESGHALEIEDADTRQLPSDDVLLALTGLGFQRQEIKTMLADIDLEHLTVEQAIKHALKR